MVSFPKRTHESIADLTFINSKVLIDFFGAIFLRFLAVVYFSNF